MKELTIIVCTHNRAMLLDECLHSLAGQTAVPEKFDVLVVDNASTDETKMVCERYCRMHSNFRYAYEPAEGLSAARNKGLRETATGWIAYIDDDAKANPDFAERILNDINQFNFDAFGGIYLPWYRFGKKKWMDNGRFFTNKTGMPEKAGELEKGYFSGGNCVFRRQALVEIGGFSIHIGMKGEKVSYGEETLVQVKLKKQGKKIGFDPQLIIHHIVMPYKLNLRWFFHSMYRNGMDHWDTFDETPSPELLRSIFSRGTKNFIRNAFICIPKLFRKDYYLQNYVIDVFCEYGRVWGVIKGGRLKLKK